MLHAGPMGMRGCLLQAYVFKGQKVRDVVKSNLRDCMEGQRYDPVKASKVRDASCCDYSNQHPPGLLRRLRCALDACLRMQQAKQLADLLLRSVDALGFHRHKYVIQVCRTLYRQLLRMTCNALQ